MLGLSLSVDGPNADLKSGAADAVAGAQRCGFCVAIKRVEGIGSDAGGILGPAMMRAGGCLMGREGGLRNFESRSGAPGTEEQPRVVAGPALRPRMVAAEHIMPDVDRPSV